MNTGDIVLTLIIFIIFALLFATNILAVGLNNVKNNWPTYRCNPVVMPFASMFGADVKDNFVYCIQNMQTNYMGYLLQPVNYAINLSGNIGKELMEALNYVRAMFNYVRNMITEIIQNVFGVFLNILIEFQKITIDIKDTIMKLTGLMTSLLYILNGSIMTMNSAWAGPPGQMVRGLCFHPETLIRLEDGCLKKISEIELGDKLKDGGEVLGLMKLKNWKNDNKSIQAESFYELPNGENGESIFVTGKHLMLNSNTKSWIEVKDFNESKLSNKESKFLYCLLTSTYVIPIGDYIFHDWDDENDGKPAKQVILPTEYVM
jgi:hypothetical protein